MSTKHRHLHKRAQVHMKSSQACTQKCRQTLCNFHTVIINNSSIRQNLSDFMSDVLSVAKVIHKIAMVVSEV